MDLNLVVGSEDCPISEVLKTLDSHPNFLLVKNNWSELAYRLETPSENVKKLQQDILLDKTGLYGCLYSILELFVGRLGKNATIDKLIDVLEEMGLKDCRDSFSSIRLNKLLSRTSFTWSEVTKPVQEHIVSMASRQTGFEFNLENHQHIFSTLDCSILKELMKGEKVQFLRKSLPDDIPYYISRRVAPRTVISNDIFSEKSGNDIFLFSNLEMPELYVIAGMETTGYSRDNLDYPRVRFIVLNESAHFDMICKRTKENVHLLEREGHLLIWRKTRGSIKVLQNCQIKGQVELREDVFMDMGGNLPVIISDTAGMGKSTLLAKIGKLICESSSTFVSFVVFPDFIRQIKDFSVKSSLSLKEVTATVLETIICLNSLGREVFRYKLYQDEKQFKLLLDGFDETNSEDIVLAFEILSTISSFKSPRVWVTSRPQFLNKLENTLNVLGFNILPFNREDQVQFFISYWSRSESVNEVNLKDFSKLCLDTLNARLNDGDKEITGIPLQCLMVGEVFKDYLGFENAEASLKSSIRSITDLYQRFIECKFQKFKQLHSLSDKQKMLLLETHTKLSFELIFGDNKMAKLLFGIASAPITSMLNVGIVEYWSEDQSPRFIHRTFAEYLIAVYLVEKLTCGDAKTKFWNQDRIKFFLLDVLHVFGSNYIRSVYQQFRYSVVCHFLNSLLVNLSFKNDVLVTLRNTFRQEVNFNSTSILKICYAAVTHNYWGIFIFLDKLEAFADVEGETFTKSFLDISIKYGDIQIFECALKHFENKYKFSNQIKIEIFERALKKGSFIIAEFLLKTKGLDEIAKTLNLPLISYVVQNTKNDYPAMLCQRRDMINVFYQQNPSLLEVLDEKGRTPIISKCVHIELLLTLIKMGANILAQEGQNGNTLLNNASEKRGVDLKINQLQKLLETMMEVNEPGLRKLLQIRGWKKEKPFRSLLFTYSRDPLKETIELVVKMGVNLNELDREGYSYLAVAVNHGSSVQTFQTLSKLGADVHWKHHKMSQTLIHRAASVCNLHILIHLLDNYKLGINDLDSKQNSPLDIVAKRLNLEIYDQTNAVECAMELIRRGGCGKTVSMTSILHYAIALGKEEAVMYLIFEKNVDVKKGNQSYMETLWKRIKSEKIQPSWSKEGHYLFRVFANLLEANVDLEAKGLRNKNFLHVLMGNYSGWNPELFHSFLEMLIKHNLCHLLKQADDRWITPIHVGIKPENVSVETLILLKNL